MARAAARGERRRRLRIHRAIKLAVKLDIKLNIKLAVTLASNRAYCRLRRHLFRCAHSQAVALAGFRRRACSQKFDDAHDGDYV